MDTEAFLFALLIFWVLLYILGRFFHLEKFGLKIQPAYFIYTSKRFNKILSTLSKKGSTVLKVFFNIGVGLAGIIMIYAIYFLIDNLSKFIRPGGAAIPIGLVIPGITLKLYWLPYFLVAAAIIVTTHEAAHGIAAQLEEIPLESTGIWLVIIFLGAYVGLKEKKFEKVSTFSKLRVISAGSSINLAVGLLVFIVLTTFYAPASGILILETVENSPREQTELQRWDTIFAINETKISNIMDLENYMVNVGVGENLILETNKGNILIITTKGPENRAIIGLTYPQHYYPCRLGLGYRSALHLYQALNWTFIFTFNIVIFNMLPLYPFDGDKFLYYTLKKIVKGKSHQVRVLFNVACFGLIATNILLSFLRYGLFSL